MFVHFRLCGKHFIDTFNLNIHSFLKVGPVVILTSQVKKWGGRGWQRG